MKSYTTIEQSKSLIEFGLDPNTADMYYPNTVDIKVALSIEVKRNNPLLSQEIPCWSLAALLYMLPMSIEFRKGMSFFLNITKDIWNGTYYNVSYSCEGTDGDGVEFETKELIDAAYNMITWLLENKYLPNNS